VKKKKGKDATRKIMSSAFWKGVTFALRCLNPWRECWAWLMMMCGHQWCFRYGEVAKAKKEIKEEFGNVELQYKDVMATVDKKMKDRLEIPTAFGCISAESTLQLSR
jgi:hypothetical protein